MMRVQVVIISLFSLVYGNGFAQAQTVPDVYNLQVINSENPGVFTLNDFLDMADNWFPATVDDATIQYTRNGLAGPGGSFWPVYLDGTRLDLNVWDTKNLNKLPVTPSQIDSVVFVKGPALRHGTFTEKGGLFIYTKNPKKGFQASAELSTGNKSGDPGPFVYTDQATRNLERLGPVASLTASYGSENYSLKTGIKHYVHSVSDPIQYPRLVPLQFGNPPYRHPKIKGDSFYLQGQAVTGRMKNTLQLGGSEFTDFLFTGLYGAEVPIDHNWWFASLDGTYQLDQNSSLRYHFKRNRNNVHEYPNKENNWLRWDQMVTTGRASFGRKFEKGHHEAGVAVDLYKLNKEVDGSGSVSTSLLKAFSHLRFELAPATILNTDLMLVRGEENGLAFKTSTGLTHQISGRHSLRFNLSYAERFPEEDNTLWYWIGEKGFGGDTLASFMESDLAERIRFWQADMEWSFNLSRSIQFNLGSKLSRNLDEYLFQYSLNREGSRIFTESNRLIRDMSTTLLTVPVGIRFQPLPHLHGSTEYIWNNPLGGDERYWEEVPDHRLNLLVNWYPVNSFNIWTRIKYRSATEWYSASPLNGLVMRVNPSNSVTLYSEQPSFFRWDLGIRKKIWDQRINIGLKAVNLLNDRYRNHPLGPRHTFSLYLNLRLILP